MAGVVERTVEPAELALDTETPVDPDRTEVLPEPLRVTDGVTAVETDVPDGVRVTPLPGLVCVPPDRVVLLTVVVCAAFGVATPDVVGFVRTEPGTTVPEV